MNERMADAAERASLAAAFLGGPAYSHDTLSQAWVRVLWNQFHDTLPGTCVLQAYTFTWNFALDSAAIKALMAQMPQ